MKTARAALIATFIAAFAPASTARAADEPTTEAQKEASDHFLRGVEYFRDADYRAALIEFRRAHELAPNYRVLFNIGQTSLELQDYSGSLEAFETYLSQGGSEIPPERRAQVEANVKRLLARVANVTVNVNVPNASIMLDDIVIGTSPLAHPIRIGAGRHKIAASTPDTVPVTRVLELAGGESTTVKIELLLPTRAGARVSRGNRPEEPPSKLPFWIGVGVTGALAVGTAVVGLVTLSKKDDFDTQLGRYVADGNSDISSARSSMKSTALVFDILAGATLVAAGTTLVIGLTRSGGAKSTGQVRLPHLLQGSF